MNPNHYQSPDASNEELLQDPAVQDGLRKVFGELDNLYSGVKETTSYGIKGYTPSITPDGTFIEACKIATPLPKDYDPRNPDHTAAVVEHHRTTEYMVFMFNIADLRDPNFRLEPKPVKHVRTGRGGGIDITLSNPDDPEPPSPRHRQDENGREYTDEEIEARLQVYVAWRNRNVVHLPQVQGDTVRLGDRIVAEPFRVVRQRAGVDLYATK